MPMNLNLLNFEKISKNLSSASVGGVFRRFNFKKLRI